MSSLSLKKLLLVYKDDGRSQLLPKSSQDGDTRVSVTDKSAKRHAKDYIIDSRPIKCAAQNRRAQNRREITYIWLEDHKV